MANKQLVKPQPIVRARPAFLADLASAYSVRRKKVILLTGDTDGRFANEETDEFFTLEGALRREFTEQFHFVRMDLASGISFYDPTTQQWVLGLVQQVEDNEEKVGFEKLKFDHEVRNSRHQPIASMVLLEQMVSALRSLRTSKPEIKPLCIIVQFAGSLFPQGDFDRMGELDRQRLVYFLNWMQNRGFAMSPDLIILVSPNRSEVNSKILALPHAEHIEIQLPTENERARFVDTFCRSHKGIRVKGGRHTLVSDSAGLTIAALEDLLETACATGKELGRKDIVGLVNQLLESKLHGIARVRYPTHGPQDVIGYAEAGEIFRKTFARCEDPEHAVPAFLIVGPNGVGKTYLAEAYAFDSGRVVIELTGLRRSLLGETDATFEIFRLVLLTFGKVLILVDEAHTAFGSVHQKDVHETEKRLSGNLIKMMSDPLFLGKVVWGLMTSRPDEMDPDIKSRSPIQIPLFDLEGEERVRFVVEMFQRKGVRVSDEMAADVVQRTAYYSARDYRNLLTEVLAEQRQRPNASILEVMDGWQASHSIIRHREFQELIASQHCSYPKLLPERLRNLDDAEVSRRIDELRVLLRYH